MHLACFSGGYAMLISDAMPSGVIVTISPGFTSRTNSASTAVIAQLSDARK